MCGEKTVYINSGGGDVGSPPHVRGKAVAHDATVFCNGITPACAGKRTQTSLVQRITRDHPRMCGEKTKKIP